MPDLAEMSLAVNFAIFAAAAGVVWFAGYRIAHYADVISARTGLGHALLGLLLLGGVTSLPELAVTLTASLSGNPSLAINNILGGVAMQVAILAIADFYIGRRALTSVVPDSIVLLQGALNIVLLSIVAVATIVGDVALLGIGLWSWLILLLFLIAMRMLSLADQRQPWLANVGKKRDGDDQEPGEAQDAARSEAPLSSVIAKATAAGAIILVAGYFVSDSGEAIAEKTGLGSSFVGAAFVAISTSLPELSTVLAAVRLGFFTMAISDILGTNLFDVALLFFVDVASPGQAVIASAGRFASVGALLGILVTGLFLVGLAERRDRTVFRFGVDSLAVMVAYIGGLILLFSLR